MPSPQHEAIVAMLQGQAFPAEMPSPPELMINLPGLQEMGRMYAGAKIRDALASPIHADFRGLPPLHILVGTREMLLDDSNRVAALARKAGVPVMLERGPGLIHVWPLFGDEVPEAADAVANIAAFIRTRVAG